MDFILTGLISLFTTTLGTFLGVGAIYRIVYYIEKKKSAERAIKLNQELESLLTELHSNDKFKEGDLH